MRRVSVTLLGAVGGRPDLLSNSTPPPSELPSVSIEKYVYLHDSRHRVVTGKQYYCHRKICCHVNVLLD